MTATSTMEQLRSDIDSGRTGDKVNAFDPAAAPLGTDEEAAGTPVPGSLIDLTRKAERAAAVPVRGKGGLGAVWLLIAFIMAFGVGMTTWMMAL